MRQAGERLQSKSTGIFFFPGNKMDAADERVNEEMGYDVMPLREIFTFYREGRALTCYSLSQTQPPHALFIPLLQFAILFLSKTE